MVQIRRAASEDAAAMRSLALASSPTLLELGLPADDPLVVLQHEAQERSWRAAHPSLTRWVAVVGGRVVGRCYLAEDDDGLVLVDLVVAEGDRGKGLGTRLLTWVLARANGAPVRLHVTHGNPARALYLRHGFEEVARDEVRALLVRPASPDR